MYSCRCRFSARLSSGIGVDMQSIHKFSWAASGAIAIFAALLFLLAVIPEPRPEDRHGGIFLLALSIILLPISAYSFLIGLWFKKAWPGKWFVLALPAIAAVGIIALSILGLIPPI
jgi:hypothetical protein